MNANELPITYALPMTVQDFLKLSIPERKNLVGEWFKEGAPIMIAGLPGCGKSLFAYTLVCGLSSGQEVFGWKVAHRKKIGILDGEMYDYSIQERLHSILKGMGQEEDPGEMVICTRDLFNQSEKRVPNLQDPEDRKEVIRLFQNIDVLLIDNINTFFPNGDENSSAFWAAVQEFTFGCRKNRISPILIHHTPKSSPDRPAGNSKNVRVVEVSIVLTKISDTEGQGAHFKIQFSKERDLASDISPRTAKASFCNSSKKLTWETQLQSKFSPEEQAVILEFQKGESFREIEKKCGVPRSTAERMVKRFQLSQCPIPEPKENGTVT